MSTDSPLTDESDWSTLSGQLKAYDEQREVVIKRCRDFQKLAKQAIFSLHRNDQKTAEKQLATAEGIAKELLPIIEKNPTLRQGSFGNAVEEYAEAQIFKIYLQQGRLATSKEIQLAEAEEYLGGVLDFTGELNRYAVQQATARNTAEVKKCRDLVEAIMGHFLQLDLRNGSLRKKYDGLKYTLKKLENTLYELSLTESTAGLLKPSTEDVDEEGPMYFVGGSVE